MLVRLEHLCVMGEEPGKKLSHCYCLVVLSKFGVNCLYVSLELYRGCRLKGGHQALIVVNEKVMTSSQIVLPFKYVSMILHLAFLKVHVQGLESRKHILMLQVGGKHDKY